MVAVPRQYFASDRSCSRPFARGKAAKELGVEIPAALSAQADRMNERCCAQSRRLNQPEVMPMLRRDIVI